MASTSTSSGTQPHHLDTNNQQLTQLPRQGLGAQMQASPADGIPHPGPGEEMRALGLGGWWAAFLKFTRIMSFLQSIFGEHRQGDSERPTSSQPETSSPKHVSYGNNNTNVGNTNNSHNNTTTFNGPVGAYGDHARNKWTSPQFHMGQLPQTQT